MKKLFFSFIFIWGVFGFSQDNKTSISVSNVLKEVFGVTLKEYRDSFNTPKRSGGKPADGTFVVYPKNEFHTKVYIKDFKDNILYGKDLKYISDKELKEYGEKASYYWVKPVSDKEFKELQEKLKKQKPTAEDIFKIRKRIFVKSDKPVLMIELAKTND